MQRYVGIPFVDRGHCASGCDCWGLVRYIYSNEVGIELPDFDISAFDVDRVVDQMERSKKEWDDVTKSPEPYDVVAMHLGTRYFGMVNHVGVYMGDGKFIHTMEKTGSMVNRLSDAVWTPRILGIYRWVN